MGFRTAVAFGLGALISTAEVANAQGAGHQPPSLLNDLVEVSRGSGFPAQLWCSPSNQIRPPRRLRGAAMPECLERVSVDAVYDAAHRLRERRVVDLGRD